MIRGELSEVADINIDHHQGSRGIITRGRLFRDFESIEICKEQKSSGGDIRSQPRKEGEMSAKSKVVVAVMAMTHAIGVGLILTLYIFFR